MKSKKTCTCIIPCYNEGPRIGAVLSVVLQSKKIDQIVCVDDGSTDNTTAVIRENFPGVRLVKLEKNQGKAAAVLQGVLASKSDYVFLLDADLKGLNLQEVERAVRKIVNNPEIDMIILRRTNALPQIKLVREDILISGERIFRRSDLLEILGNDSVSRWELEPAINRFMMENGKNVYWMPNSATNTFPVEKLGFLAGLKKSIAMHATVFSYLGFVAFTKQMLMFCKKRAY